MNAPFVKETSAGVFLSVKVQPRASRQRIVGIQGNELKISVTAPPVDSAANEALVEFMAEVLDLPVSSLELTRGHTSRHKTLLIRGRSVEALLQVLNPHLP